MPEPLTPVSPLAALSPLGGHASSHDGASLAEVTGMAFVSLAVSQGSQAAFARAVKKAWKIDVPPPGMSAAAGDIRLIWTAPGQYHLLMPEPGGDPLAPVTKAVSGTAWTTDQSDSYCLLRLEGARSREALERICPLDLHPGSFAVDAASRTVMEHLGALLIREGTDRYLLMSARSSALSFLHAVETSIQNIA